MIKWFIDMCYPINYIFFARKETIASNAGFVYQRPVYGGVMMTNSSANVRGLIRI